MSDLQCTSSWLQHELLVMPSWSDPSVFTRSLKPLNHIPQLPLYTTITLHILKPSTQKPSSNPLRSRTWTNSKPSSQRILSQWQPHHAHTTDLQAQTPPTSHFPQNNVLLTITQMQTKSHRNTFHQQILSLSSTCPHI